MKKPHILAITPKVFEEYLTAVGEKKYRVQQVFKWIYEKDELDFENMTSLPEGLRKKLKNDFETELPEIIERKLSADGTTKYLLKLYDNHFIETVLIPNEKKNTLCISSQVGCSRNCSFCATGKLGLKRNLNTFEILAQIYLVGKELRPAKLTNIVFMGMGEPLDNFENMIDSLNILQNERCFKFSPRRITVSTCGIIPEITKLGNSGIKVKLAVSLNSAIQEKREKLMPVAKQYSLSELKKTLLDFRKKNPYRITFEYIMMKNVNISEKDAKALIKFAGDISCKINLIKWNEVDSFPYHSPADEEVEIFREKLEVIPAAVTFRQSRGSDIEAACGQLAGKYAEQ